MASSSPLLRASESRTERLVGDLLNAQGWDLRRPPAGNLLQQQEYKSFPELEAMFKGKAKAGGGGDALPDFLLMRPDDGLLLAVIEAKAKAEEIDQAIKEATQDYGDACVDAGHNPLAVGVAGNLEDGFEVRVHKWTGTKWSPVTYEKRPISWVPSPEDVETLQAQGVLELRPTPPPKQVLADRADEINRLLRESRLKDEFRPPAIAAIMLALWQSQGNIRRAPQHILRDINQACEQAFWKAEKPELAKSLRVDEANKELAARARRIAQILETLGVHQLSAEHDYLGQLYEEFFRYTGGNTIGQYFTPRHIASFMADLAEVGKDDMVLDPACGTGGFLIAAMHRVLNATKLSRKQVIKLVRDHLIGFEQEPVTAALCVANMILRGDGTSGVVQGDCFTHPDYPEGKATVALMNPPFPHKKTDTPPERFVDRALEGLTKRGVLAVIVPASQLVKQPKAAWRSKVLKSHRLLAVVSLPNELFQPYASSTTAILVFEQGVAQGKGHRTFFAHVDNDGYRLKKNVRVPVTGDELPSVLKAYFGKTRVPGFCDFAEIRDDEGWAPGAYITAKPHSKDVLQRVITYVIRSKTAMAVLNTPSLQNLRRAVDGGEVAARPYSAYQGGRRSPTSGGSVVAGHFDIFYGQKELHSKEGLVPGSGLVISSSGVNNGCYGFFDYPDLIEPPFVTVPSTGSIGEAYVQEWPCGVTDDCLLLFPQKGVPKEALYIAAAVIRLEQWRFNYGRKITPARIANFPMPMDDDLIQFVRTELAKAKQVEKAALKELD